MTMNSNDVLLAIEEIGAVSSKNTKQDLVKKSIDDPLFQSVMIHALNPLITYGMADVPDRQNDDVNGETFDDFTFDLLYKMAQRELTGTAAREAVAMEMNRLSHMSAGLLKRIIKKDLRAGFSESTVNKAKKGLIPDFPYMRCSLPKDAKLDAWNWAAGVLSQEKADGMFANVNLEVDGSVVITSRAGTAFPIEKFGHFIEEVRARLLMGYQHHGEFLVKRDGVVLDREIGNGIMNSIANGGDFAENETPLYLVWDAIPLSAVVTKGTHEETYKTRFSRILKSLKETPSPFGTIGLIPTKIVKSLGEAYAHAGLLMKAGKEGTIVKNPDMIWKDGTSKDQVKLKLEFTVDLKVTNIMPGKKDTKNEGRAGALRCESSCGQLVVDVTVKNEAMRDDVDANPDNWLDGIIEVVANDIMVPSESSDKYSLFLPRMAVAEVRTDKFEADDLERIVAIKEAAIFGESLKEAA